MTTTSKPSLFGRIGQALNRIARVYVDARLMQARWYALSELDAHTLRDIGGDRFGMTMRDFMVDATPPANANDDDASRRAA